MFRKKTVFILGAGASKDIGMPTGPELARIIGSKTAIANGELGDGALFNALERRLQTNANSIVRAFRTINEGIVLSASIDDFLDLHREDEIVVAAGKAAIVKAIRESESECSLVGEIGKPLDTIALANSWYVKLMQMLTRDVDRGNAVALASNVSFVNFNYDRCIEQFLLRAVAQSYALPVDQAVRVCREFKFYHPYGSLGGLPELAASGAVASSFGNLGSDLIASSEGIRTYTEQAESRVLKDIKSAIAGAEQLVFLGFGFHQQNMQILRPAQPLQSATALATTYNVSNADSKVVAARILSFYNPTFRQLISDGMSLSNSTCDEFFSEFQLTLPS